LCPPPRILESNLHGSQERGPFYGLNETAQIWLEISVDAGGLEGERAADWVWKKGCGWG